MGRRSVIAQNTLTKLRKVTIRARRLVQKEVHRTLAIQQTRKVEDEIQESLVPFFVAQVELICSRLKKLDIEGNTSTTIDDSDE